MSDESETEVSSGLDLSTVSQRLARERASNSIRIRRTRYTQPNRTNTSAQSQSSETEDQLSMIANETQTKFSPEIIVETFQSNNVSLIEGLCVQLAQFIKEYPEITTIEDTEVIELIVSSATVFNTSSSVSNYLSLILVLSIRHECEIVDSGLFFILRDEVFPTYPLEVCNFYSVIPSVSKYAKNTMLCIGIMNDLIDAFKQSTSEVLSIELTKAIHATLSCSFPEDADSIRDFLPELVGLLCSTCVTAVYYVLLSLVEVLGISTTFISPMFKLNVHTMIVELMTNAELAGPCIAIAGNMAICSDNEISGMIPIFEVEKGLIGGEFTGDVFWCLMNGLDSCPIVMLPFFDMSFIEIMASLLQDSPYGVFRDVSCFAATLIVLEPAQDLKAIISHNVLGPLIDMLDCGNPPIVLRCLDGLKKVVMLAFTDPQVIESAPDLFQNDELPEVLDRLQQLDEQMIVARASQLESDLQLLSAQ